MDFSALIALGSALVIVFVFGYNLFDHCHVVEWKEKEQEQKLIRQEVLRRLREKWLYEQLIAVNQARPDIADIYESRIREEMEKELARQTSS